MLFWVVAILGCDNIFDTEYSLTTVTHGETQNGRQFAANILLYIFCNYITSIVIKISLKFAPNGPVG